MRRVSTVRTKAATTSVRMLRSQRQLVIEAATCEGVSLGEFLRRAASERSAKILSAQEQQLRQAQL